MIKGKCKKCGKEFKAHTEKELNNQIMVHILSKHGNELNFNPKELNKMGVKN